MTTVYAFKDADGDFLFATANPLAAGVAVTPVYADKAIAKYGSLQATAEGLSNLDMLLGGGRISEGTTGEDLAEFVFLGAYENTNLSLHLFA